MLLIEDDRSTTQSIKLMLQSEGHDCDCVDLGESGFLSGRDRNYDTIILDLMLPDIDGFEVLRRLRMAHVKTPVLILSGLQNAAEKVRGLGIGADDYLTKPFDKRELTARLSAIVRRSTDHSNLDDTIQTGKILLNVDDKTIQVEGVPLHFTNKEYDIFELLSQRKGTIVTKEMFLNHLYGGIDEPAAKIIDVFVCKLRKKLISVTGGENCIETVWGRGYKLIDPSDHMKK